MIDYTLFDLAVEVVKFLVQKVISHLTTLEVNTNSLRKEHYSSNRS